MSEYRPKILQIITLFSVGGATETVVSMSRGLLSNNYDVTIVSGEHIPSEGNMMPFAETAGIKVLLISQLKRDIHPVNDVRAFFILLRLIRRGSYDIVHTHSSKAGILGRFAARLAGVPHIVHTIHGLPFHRYQSALRNLVYVLAERVTAMFTDTLISVSETIVRECNTHNIRPKSSFEVVRSGFETESYQFRTEKRKEFRDRYGIKDNDFIIGKISRLSRLKGHDRLLRILPDVVKSHPNLKFAFIGDGEMRSELTDLVNKSGLEDVVKFIGTVSPSEIPDTLCGLDAVIHTSLHEGLPRVIPQALLLGLPVISYNLDGAPEIIRNGVNGFLVDPNDERDLINAIDLLLRNLKTLKEHCAADRGRIEIEFGTTKMVNDVCKIYRKLLD